MRCLSQWLEPLYHIGKSMDMSKISSRRREISSIQYNTKLVICKDENYMCKSLAHIIFIFAYNKFCIVLY